MTRTTRRAAMDADVAAARPGHRAVLEQLRAARRVAGIVDERDALFNVGISP